MPPRPRGRKDNGGFALLVVIWGLGVIMLLIIGFMTTARWRLQAAFNVFGAARASLAADGAINAAILGLLMEQGGDVHAPRPIHDGEPRFCTLLGGAAAIAIEDETGKVDLNGAPPQLLQAMFMGLGVEKRAADALANAIVAFRGAPANDIGAKAPEYDAMGKPFGPKRAPFQTVMELDQVAGVAPALFRDALPFVTTHSRGFGVDPLSAPPGLFAALAGFAQVEVRALISSPFPNRLDRRDSRFPASFGQGQPHGAFLVHAEVVLPTGQTSAREAIVELRAGDEPFAIRELRRGAARYAEDLRAAIRRGAPGPEC
jgi:general secretion pathway protein K